MKIASSGSADFFVTTFLFLRSLGFVLIVILENNLYKKLETGTNKTITNPNAAKEAKIDTKYK